MNKQDEILAKLDAIIEQNKETIQYVKDWKWDRECERRGIPDLEHTYEEPLDPTK